RLSVNLTMFAGFIALQNVATIENPTKCEGIWQIMNYLGKNHLIISDDINCVLFPNVHERGVARQVGQIFKKEKATIYDGQKENRQKW
ncbi:hypothetical protein NPIL_93691, partial [Nephila pilipes]